MGRPAKFDTDAVLDAALRVLEGEGVGAVSASRVCEELGAPSGSFYHRFESRDALLIELWLRCAERFQQGIYEALESSEDVREAAYAAVRQFLQRARQHRGEALVLMSYRREDLINGPWPAAVRKRAKALEEMQKAAMLRFARRLWPQGNIDPGRMGFALLQLPHAAAVAELRGSKSAASHSLEWVMTAVDALLGDCWKQAAGDAQNRTAPPWILPNTSGVSGS